MVFETLFNIWVWGMLGLDVVLGTVMMGWLVVSLLGEVWRWYEKRKWYRQWRKR